MILEKKSHFKKEIYKTVKPKTKSKRIYRIPALCWTLFQALGTEQGMKWTKVPTPVEPSECSLCSFSQDPAGKKGFFLETHLQP